MNSKKLVPNIKGYGDSFGWGSNTRSCVLGCGKALHSGISPFQFIKSLSSLSTELNGFGRCKN